MMINTKAPIDVPTVIGTVEPLVPERLDAAVVVEFNFEPKLELRLVLGFRLKIVDMESIVDCAVVRKRAENEDPST